MELNEVDNWWHSKWTPVVSLIKKETFESKSEGPSSLVCGVRRCLEFPDQSQHGLFVMALVPHLSNMTNRLVAWAESWVAQFPVGPSLQQACNIHSTLSYLLEVFADIEHLVLGNLRNAKKEWTEISNSNNSIKKSFFTPEIRHYIDSLDASFDENPVKENVCPVIVTASRSLNILRGTLTNLVEPEIVSVVSQLWQRTKSATTIFSQLLVPILCQLDGLHAHSRQSLSRTFVMGLRDYFATVSRGTEVLTYIRNTVRPNDNKDKSTALSVDDCVMISDILMQS